MQKLFELFEEIGLPYFRQGSLSDEDYPPSFFTFWNIDTPYLRHRDNKAKEHALYIQVGFYTNDASKIYSQLGEGEKGEFIEKAKARKFKIAGLPRDANADKDNYFGRVCYIRIIEKTEE
jgi:hypothetical protein